MIGADTLKARNDQPLQGKVALLTGAVRRNGRANAQFGGWDATRITVEGIFDTTRAVMLASLRG